MKKILSGIIVIILLLVSCTQNNPKEEITINLQEKGAEVAPSMYGVFFEEINHAGDGGLYAELVKNRSFEELEMPAGYHAVEDVLYPKKVHNHITGEVRPERYRWTTEPVPGWKLKADESVAGMKMTKESPKFNSAPNNLKLSIKNADQPISLVNEGYWGMGIKANENYRLRVIVRPSLSYNGKITAKIISENDDVLASTIIDAPLKNQWNDFEAVLVPTAKDSKAKLALEFDGTGEVYLDYVSLFPENTFNNRPNGLRTDVAEMIAGLKPAFFRWPGGCVVEGITLDNRFEWKKSLGDPASRSGEYSTWGYRCSYGFGYYEMLQYCEDINADAMFVCNVGLGCQYRMADASTENQIQYYVDDCLDAIEYALGDVNTKWGALRAEHGHPAAFPLKYVEIGNENWGDEYDKRFDIFYNAIKAKYPDLVLISNHGINGTGKIVKTDMIDPHWYVAPDFFFKNSGIFDNHPRGKYTVYVGEYACNNSVGGGNMLAALSEAAFITGMERNGDLVTMASYAPLLENRNDRAWPVNLIWLDTDQTLGRSSYYVQKMSAENRPTYNVKLSKNLSGVQRKDLSAGYIGFGSYKTLVEFKDIRVSEGDKIIELDPANFVNEKGTWSFDNGILAQTSVEPGTSRILEGFYGGDFILELKARKTGGVEGFFIYAGVTEDKKSGYVFNIGGWGNSSTAVQLYTNDHIGSVDGISVPHSIAADQWYDIKIIGSAEKAELYMDGELILTYKPETIPLQFFASGYDEVSGEVIIKVVNAEEKPYSVKFNLSGANEVAKSGKIISLKANSLYDENSFEEPEKIYPQESEFNGFGNAFSYEFPAISYTVLRVKAKLN